MTGQAAAKSGIGWSAGVRALGADCAMRPEADFPTWRFLVLAALFALAGPASQPAIAQSKPAGDEASYFELGTGAFNTQAHRGKAASAEGLIAFRYGKKLFLIGPAIIGPTIGVSANTDGGVFGYAGLYSDLSFDRFILTPLAAAGGYDRGHGEDLGGTFEFRLSLTAAYQLDDGSRIGLQFAHVSNAGIYRHNPGDNELLLTYAFPVKLPF